MRSISIIYWTSYGLYFRRNDTVDFVGDGTVEKPTTETIEVDTEIMFPSCGRAEIYGSKTSQKKLAVVYPADTVTIKFYPALKWVN